MQRMRTSPLSSQVTKQLCRISIKLQLSGNFHLILKLKSTFPSTHGTIQMIDTFILNSNIFLIVIFVYVNQVERSHQAWKRQVKNRVEKDGYCNWPLELKSFQTVYNHRFHSAIGEYSCLVTLCYKVAVKDSSCNTSYIVCD